MEFIEGKGIVALSFVGSLATFILGAWDLPLQILLVAVVLDYLCGTMKAFYLGKVSSKVGYKGIIKKMGIFFMVVVAQLADMTLGLEVLRNTVCIAYTVNELYSISENVAIMDVYIPPFIKDKLIQVKEVIEKIEPRDTDKKE